MGDANVSIGNIGDVRAVGTVDIDGAQIDVGAISVESGDILITGTNIDLNGEHYVVTGNTSGEIIFTGAVDLDLAGGTTTVQTTGAIGDDITFSSTINDDASGNTVLILNAGAAGNVSTGNIGGIHAVRTVDIDGAQIDIGDVTVDTGELLVTGTNIDLNGSGYIALSGEIIFTGAVDLGQAGGTTVVQTAGAVGENITFSSTINDDVVGDTALTLNAGAAGNVSTGNIGGGKALDTVDIDGAQIDVGDITVDSGDILVTGTNIDLNGAGYVVLTSGEIIFTGAVDLEQGGGTTVVQTAGGGGDNITFSFIVNDDVVGDTALTLNAGAAGNVTTLTIGAITAVGAVDIDGAQIDIGDITVDSGDILVTGTNIDLNGAGYVVLTSGEIIFTGAVDLDQSGGTTTVQTAGAVGDDITFSSTINDDVVGDTALTLNAGAAGNVSTLTIGGVTAVGTVDIVGAQIDVSDITVDSGDIRVTGTNIDLNNASYLANTSGEIIFTGAVDLDQPGGTTVVQTAGAVGDDITFSSTINDDVVGDTALTLNAGAAGNVSTGNIGGGKALDTVDIDGAQIDVSDITVNTGNIAVNATIINVNGVLTTTGGAGGVLTLNGGGITLNATPIVDGDDITLNGGGDDLIIAANITDDATVSFTANRDIIIRSGFTVDTSGSGTADINFTGDGDGDGDGGVILEGTAALDAGQNIDLEGSDVNGANSAIAGSLNNESVYVDGNSSVQAVGSITIQSGPNTTSAAGRGGIALNGAIVSTGGGAITVTADDDITMTASGPIASNNGNITLSADNDFANGGDVLMTGANTIDSGTGTIDIEATGTIRITGLFSDNNTALAIEISSATGAIQDADDTSADITLSNASGGLTLLGLAGIGVSGGVAADDNLEIIASTVDATNTISGGIALDSLGGTAAGVGGVNFDDIQVGGAGTLTLTGVTATTLTRLDTANGVIDVDIDGAGLTAIDVATGANNQIDLTTLNGSDITLGAVDAGTGTVNINSAGSIHGVTDDAVADVSGGTVNFVSNAIGIATIVDVSASTEFNADTSATGGNILVDLLNNTNIGLVTAGTGNVTLDATGSTIDATADDGVADIAGATITLVSNAIGTGTIVDVSSSTEFNADTSATGGNILVDLLNNTNIGFVSAGAGDVTLDATGSTIDASSDDVTTDIGGATITLVSAAIGTGTIVDVSSSTEFNADTSATGGNILVDLLNNTNIGLVTAGTGNVTLDATGSTIDATADDGVADIAGATITLVSNAIGTGTIVDVSSSTEFNADTSATGGNILVDLLNNTNIGFVSAGAGDVTLDATGSTIDASSDDVTTDIGGATITLVSAAIGTGTIVDVSSSTEFNADTSATGGNILVDLLNNTNIGLVTAGTGNVTLDATGSTIDATADDGVADIAGATITLVSAAIGTGTIVDVSSSTEFNADTSATGGNILIDSVATMPIGLVTAGAGNVTVDATGFNISGTLDGIADIVGATLNIDASTGIAGVDFTGTSIAIDNDVSGDIDVDSLATAAVTVTSLTAAGAGSSIQFEQTGNESLNITGAVSANTNITINNTGDANTDTLTIDNTVTSATAGTISISTLTRGDIAINSNITTAGGAINVDSSDDITVQVAATSISSGAGPASTIELSVDKNDDVEAIMDLGGLTLNAATINLAGGANTATQDTIVSFDAGNNTWTMLAVAGADNGTLASTTNITTAANARLTNLHNLTGNENNDTFVFSGSAVTGNISAAGGTNTLDYSGLGGPIAVTLDASGDNGFDIAAAGASQVGGAVTGITNLIGSTGTDTLTGINAAASWDIDGTNTFTSTNTLNFSAIENLIGNADVDTFSVTANHTGNMDGQGGDDTFTFADTFTVNGTVTGGDGTDIINWNAYTTARNIVLTASVADGFSGTEASITGGFVTINDVRGSTAGGQVDTLTGLDGWSDFNLDSKWWRYPI